jgi:Phosphotransferase enzyme family
MSVPALISDPGQVTADWLTAVLAHAGVLSGGVVAGFEVAAIGTGSVGSTLRYRLRYAPGAAAGPAAVVVKFAAVEEASRAAGIATHSYENEVGFYRDLAATVRIRRPRCYHAAVVEGTADVVVVMEDLAPAAQGDQLTGCDAIDAGLAMTEAARLHGPRWGDPALSDVSWLGGPGSPISVADFYRAVWGGFVDRYRSRLMPEAIAGGEALGAGLDGWTAYRAPALTITHGDFRVDNMMFAGAGPQRQLTVVDWQTVGLGGGTADVAYFLGGSLPSELRRAAESALLGRYRGALAEYGISYPPDACWADYRRHSWGGLVMAVIAGMLVSRTERSDAMFVTMANRHAIQARDLGAAEFLS